MANFKRHKPKQVVKTLDKHFDGTKVPASYDGDKVRNRKEQRDDAREDNERDDLVELVDPPSEPLE